MSIIDEETTRRVIGLERIEFRSRLGLPDGALCPVCNRHARVYRRTITSTMAACVLIMHRHFEKNPESAWVHVPRLLTEVHPISANGGDYAKLRHWGLIVPLIGERDDGSTRLGCYSMTDDGHAFATGDKTLRRYLYLYDEEPVADPPGASNERISVLDALGTKFDFRELTSW